MILSVLSFSQTTNTFIVALMVPILGVLSPLLLARQISINAQKHKELDWARQDIVAARVAEVAKEAAASSKIVIDAQNALNLKTDNLVSEVEKVHGLVNSQLTQAMKSELAAMQETLMLMGQQMDQHKRQGLEPNLSYVESYRIREERISELEKKLAARIEAEEAAKRIHTGPREVIIVNPPDTPVHVVGTTTEEEV